MKIGVVFHGNMLAGGCFQQSLNAIKLLSKDVSKHDFIYYTPDPANVISVKDVGIEVRTFKFGRKERLVHKIRKQITLNRIFGKFAFFNPLTQLSRKTALTYSILQVHRQFACFWKD